MTWISLASNRYKLLEVLEHNYSNPQNQKMRYEVIDSTLGLYALLSGEKFYIEREIEIAEFLVRNYIKKEAPPYQILSDVMGLVTIAELGKTDYTEIFPSIAETKKYKEDFQKSLQLIARRIAGLEKCPDKIRKEKGHISKEKRWFQLVKEYDSEQVFSLSVTLEHPDSFMLKKFILPLAFLLSKNQTKLNRRDYFQQILSWGETNLEKQKNIVYERLKEPDFESKNYGFDAIELDENKVVAYCYFGQNLKISELFNNEKNTAAFFQKLVESWSLIEQSVDPKIWRHINLFKEENKLHYMFVYDFKNTHLPADLIDKVSNDYGIDLSIKDITEV